MMPYKRAGETRLAGQDIEQTTRDMARAQIIADSYKSARPLSTGEILAKKIWDTNEGLKRINGHSPEYVAKHIGVTVEELFPTDGKSVYIGDPWQKLDRKGVTIVDYEFGPVAEFQDDKEVYLSVLDSRINKVETYFITPEDHETLNFLNTEISLARNLCERAKNTPLEEYENIGKSFLEMKQRIENEIERETGGAEHDPIHAVDNTVRDLWYVAVHGARAFDVLDWATELQHAYEQFAEALPEEMPEQTRLEKLKEKRRLLIESIRFEKTTKEAEVVQAMFPFLPFENETFDRFVAFWSISTYAFEHLNHDDMTSYWAEIHRLLKPDGRAYIAPLFEGNETVMHQTLNQFAEAHQNFSYHFDNDYYPSMLVIEKKVPGA